MKVSSWNSICSKNEMLNKSPLMSYVTSFTADMSNISSPRSKIQFQTFIPIYFRQYQEINEVRIFILVTESDFYIFKEETKTFRFFILVFCKQTLFTIKKCMWNKALNDFKKYFFVLWNFSHRNSIQTNLVIGSSDLVVIASWKLNINDSS